MKYNLPFPNVGGRSQVYRNELHRGDVVAFLKYESNIPRTGIIIMGSESMMLAAVNLYEEEGRIWYSDDLPDDIELFSANKKETLWGYKFFLEEQRDMFSDDYHGRNPYIAFIENECSRTDIGYFANSFYKDFLTYVPKMIEKAEWPALKQLLWQNISQSGGLQYNRFVTEYQCYLIGVIMIAESASDDYTYEVKIRQFKKEWYQLSWMYGMAIGRLVGTALNNFTAVVKQAGQGRRAHYLHLYLPLVENNIDKICKYNKDSRYKVVEAIRQMRDVEAREEQIPDLDELYHILFPKHFVLAMADSRPAATIADLKEKVAAKEQRIKELEDVVDDVTIKYNHALEELAKAVRAVESDKFSPDNLMAAFLRFPTELALSFFGSMSTLMALDTTWQKYAPIILKQILAKQKEQQDRQEQKQDKMIEEVEKAANKKTNEFNVYPQAGSTANLGCQMQSPEFKVIPPSTEQQPALESNKDDGR